MLYKGLHKEIFYKDSLLFFGFMTFLDADIYNIFVLR